MSNTQDVIQLVNLVKQKQQSKQALDSAMSVLPEIASGGVMGIMGNVGKLTPVAAAVKQALDDTDAVLMQLVTMSAKQASHIEQLQQALNMNNDSQLSQHKEAANDD